MRCLERRKETTEHDPEVLALEASTLSMNS